MALVGEIVTVTLVLPVMVTVAEPEMVGLDKSVAVTVTVGGLGTLDGAVYRPMLVMVPQVNPRQPTPDKLHVTTVFTLPVTVAVNCI